MVAKSPGVAEFKESWPALFKPFQLDKHIPKLLELFSNEGGATGQRINNLLMELRQGKALLCSEMAGIGMVDYAQDEAGSNGCIKCQHAGNLIPNSGVSQ
ncbi:unnamed protein product [Leuciscus chuanchicus]